MCYNECMNREWFRRIWPWITIIGVAVISFLVYLGLKHGIAISFAVLSIVVATFFASRSLKLTQDSLELTRITTRPFLNITSAVYQPPKTLELIICNTGTLPADSNTFQVIFSQTNDFSGTNDINNLSGSVIHESSPIFPGEKQQWDLYLVKDRAEYVNGGNEFYFKIDIIYTYFGKEHGLTSRVSHLPKSDKRRKRTTFSILSEGSSWK